MNNKELREGYNQAVQAKSTNRLAMILITLFAGIITLSALTMYFVSNYYIADKVKVVNTTGVSLESELQRETEVLSVAIQSHLDRAMFLINSFSRETLKENQAKSLFLMERESAFPIFETYKKDKSYDDALQRGHIYKVIKSKVTHLETTKGEPYAFKVTGILSIKDGIREEFWSIEGDGFITTRKPTWPNNQSGLWISDYRQRSQQIIEDGEGN